MFDELVESTSEMIFKSEYEEKWRAQRVELTLFVPEGKAIQFSKPVADHIDDIRAGRNRYSPWRMAEKTWWMHESGLENKAATAD